jgi:methenyltetrahydrofolate cyclohydrolase
MPRFADLTVAQFLDALASPDPTPGGGTAAAVAGAIGVSVLTMVAGLTKTRQQTEAAAEAMAAAKSTLAGIRERLVALADTDTEAFNQVMAAYRLAKITDEDKAARKSAIQRALVAATEAPLETLRAAAAAVVQARTVAEHGNRSAESDVRVAIELLEAAAASAAANVEINLTGLTDEAYRKITAAKAVEVANRVTEDAASARARLAAE